MGGMIKRTFQTEGVVTSQQNTLIYWYEYLQYDANLKNNDSNQ